MQDLRELRPLSADLRGSHSEHACICASIDTDITHSTTRVLPTSAGGEPAAGAGAGGGHDSEDRWRSLLSGNQCTCFTSTKVQMLTHLRRQACAAVLSLLNLLVQSYKY